MPRSYLVRSAKMKLRHLTQRRGPPCFHHLLRGFLYLGGNAAAERKSQRLTPVLEPIDKRLACKDGGRRHRQIGFCFGPLFQLDRLAVLEQRLLNDTRICEFVREGAWAIRFSDEQILNHARVAPAK